MSVNIINNLSAEMICSIFSWVDGMSLTRSQRVCKLWQQIIQSPLFLPILHAAKSIHFREQFKGVTVRGQKGTAEFRPDLIGFIAARAEICYVSVFSPRTREQEEVLYRRSSCKQQDWICMTGYVDQKWVNQLKTYSDSQILYSISNTLVMYDAVKNKAQPIVKPSKKVKTEKVEYMDVMGENIFYTQGRKIFVCKPNETSQLVTELSKQPSFLKCLKGEASATSYIFIYNKKKTMTFLPYPAATKKGRSKVTFPSEPSNLLEVEKIGQSVFFIMGDSNIHLLSQDTKTKKFNLEKEALALHTSSVTCLAGHGSLLISGSYGDICFSSVSGKTTKPLYRFNETIGVPKNLMKIEIIQRKEDPYFSLLCSSQSEITLISSSESFRDSFIKKKNKNALQRLFSSKNL